MPEIAVREGVCSQSPCAVDCLAKELPMLCVLKNFGPFTGTCAEVQYDMSKMMALQVREWRMKSFVSCSFCVEDSFTMGRIANLRQEDF